MMTLRQRFLERLSKIDRPRMVSVAVMRPEGAVEVITNYEKVEEKIEYILKTYGDDFRMVHNQDIRIVDFMLV
jgi:hypothetical protein